jgi:hypothetical protein
MAAPALENFVQYKKIYCSQTNAGDKNSEKILTQMLQPASGKT